jgi:hypothetical protein
MEDNAMVVGAAALSLSRFIAVDPSLKVLRSGKNKARHARVLRALQGKGGQGTTLSGRLGMAWSSRGPWCTVPETRQIEGLAAEALSGSAGWCVSPHTSRASGVNQHLPSDPCRMGVWMWLMDRKPFFIGSPVP